MRPLTAAEVADRLGYAKRTVQEYARSGRLPAPIDPSLPVVMWRWSPLVVEQYEAGEWTQRAFGRPVPSTPNPGVPERRPRRSEIRRVS